MASEIIGRIELQDKTNGLSLRIEKYEIIDHLNQVTNIIISSIPQSEERVTLLEEIKRLKEIANNL